jgi:hypothetical protein
MMESNVSAEVKATLKYLASKPELDSLGLAETGTV